MSQRHAPRASGATGRTAPGTPAGQAENIQYKRKVRTTSPARTALAAAILAGLSATPAAARLIVTNANGYTLAGGKIHHFDALVIGDDGKVVATYAKGRAPAATAKDQRLDAGGRTLLPGLIDAHGHVNELGQIALAVDLSDTRSRDAAVAAVVAYAGTNTRAWIVGGGWNQERWPDKRFPTATDLDVAGLTRPVYLSRIDGHAGWANHAAMQAAGVTAATPDPTGGRIERDSQGNPTGLFVDAAKALIENKIPAATAAEATARLTKSLAIMASVGLTGAGDMGVSPEDWQLYRSFDASHRLTARITAWAGGMDALAAIAPAGPIGWTPDGRLSMPGVKLYADGALGSRGAWLKADYTDAPGNRGLRFSTDAEMRGMIQKADAGHFAIAVHAIGDAANAQVLDAYAALPPRAGRWLRIEHAQVVDVADLPRFASLGVIASMQPTHATSDKGMAEARLGDARLAGAYAWQTLIRSGAAFAGGSDFPVEPPNPFYGLHAAVTRQDRSDQPAGGWRPAEKLTMEQAFAAFTTGAAAANGIAAGALTPGKWGDFIIVDQDPFKVAPAQLWKIKVDETWVGGERVFKR
ncbi:amidohydrolase [Sphingosinicellaceae bacterium]|nr:amidohydrolase [Sphingosinicellaceae bacterium]